VSFRIQQTDKALTLEEVRDFLLASLMPTLFPPKWAHYTGRNQISRVLLLYANGLNPEFMGEGPYCNGIFDKKYTTYMSGSKTRELRDPFLDLIQCPMSKKSKRQQSKGIVLYYLL